MAQAPVPPTPFHRSQLGEIARNGTIPASLAAISASERSQIGAHGSRLCVLPSRIAQTPAGPPSALVAPRRRRPVRDHSLHLAEGLVLGHSLVVLDSCAAVIMEPDQGRQSQRIGSTLTARTRAHVRRGRIRASEGYVATCGVRRPVVKPLDSDRHSWPVVSSRCEQAQAIRYHISGARSIVRDFRASDCRSLNNGAHAQGARLVSLAHPSHTLIASHHFTHHSWHPLPSRQV